MSYEIHFYSTPSIAIHQVLIEKLQLLVRDPYLDEKLFLHQ